MVIVHPIRCRAWVCAPVASQSLRPQTQIKWDHFFRKPRFRKKFLPRSERANSAAQSECAERSAAPLFSSPAKRVLNSYQKCYDEESRQKAKSTASRGRCKPGESNLPPKITSEQRPERRFHPVLDVAGPPPLPEMRMMVRSKGWYSENNRFSSLCGEGCFFTPVRKNAPRSRKNPPHTARALHCRLLFFVL